MKRSKQKEIMERLAKILWDANPREAISGEVVEVADLIGGMDAMQMLDAAYFHKVMSEVGKRYWEDKNENSH